MASDDPSKSDSSNTPDTPTDVKPAPAPTEQPEPKEPEEPKDEHPFFPPPTTPPNDAELKAIEQKAKDTCAEASKEATRWGLHQAVETAAEIVVGTMSEGTGLAAWEALDKILLGVHVIGLSTEVGSVVEDECAEMTKHAQEARDQNHAVFHETFDEYMKRLNGESSGQYQDKKKKADAAWDDYEKLYEKVYPGQGLVRAYTVQGEAEVQSNARTWAVKVVKAVQGQAGTSPAPAPKPAPAPAPGDNTSMDKAAPLARGQVIQGTLPSSAGAFYKITLKKGEKLGFRLYMRRVGKDSSFFRVAIGDSFGGTIAQQYWGVTVAEGDLVDTPNYSFTAPDDDEFIVRFSVDSNGGVVRYRILAS